MEDHNRLVDNFFVVTDLQLTNKVLLKAAPSAVCNGALAVQHTELSQSQGSLSDRLFELYQQSKVNRAQNNADLELKFIIMHVVAVHRAVVEASSDRCLVEWSIDVTPEQLQRAEFFIFVFEGYSEAVAIVSSRVLRTFALGYNSNGHVIIARRTSLDSLRLAYPRQVYPWMVHHLRLNECFTDIIASTNSLGVPKGNPLSFVVVQGWFPKTSGYEGIMPSQRNLSTFEQISRIYMMFKTSPYGISLELMSPGTGGTFMLCQSSPNIYPFIIKYRLNPFQTYGTSRDHLSLVLQPAGSERIFENRANFEYFWADTAYGYGYFIPRDYIPADWKDDSKDMSDWFDVLRTPLAPFQIPYVGDVVRHIIEIVSRNYRPRFEFRTINNGVAPEEVLGDTVEREGQAGEGLFEEYPQP